MNVCNAIGKGRSEAVCKRGHPKKYRHSQTEFVSLIEERKEVRGAGTKGSLKGSKKTSADNETSHVVSEA